MLKNQNLFKSYFILAILTMTVLFSSCQAIAGIFKAGVWVGVIAVVAVIGVIIWIISSIAGGGK